MRLTIAPGPCEWPPWLWHCGVVLLSAPAILSFGAHVVEHRIPLGFTRGPASSLLPQWVGFVLLAAAFKCTVPTWCAAILAVWTTRQRGLAWWAKASGVVVATLAHVSMRGITDVLHSCWGEAPHPFWW